MSLPLDPRGNPIQDYPTTPNQGNLMQEDKPDLPPNQVGETSRSRLLLEQALLRLRSGQQAEALRLLEEASQSGKDEAAQSAKALLVRERAATGALNPQDLQDAQNPAEKSRLFLAAADGYRQCLQKKPEDMACREGEQRALFEAANGEISAESLQARLRLAGGFIEQGRFSQARDILLPVLQGTLPEKKVPWDQAWFYLARALEADTAQQDPFRAAQAYAKVLEIENSVYLPRARQAIKRLQRYHLGESF